MISMGRLIDLHLHLLSTQKGRSKRLQVKQIADLFRSAALGRNWNGIPELKGG